MKHKISILLAVILLLGYPIGAYADSSSGTVSYNYIYNVSQADYDSKYKSNTDKYSIYETKTEYRYRDKSTVNSGQDKLDGYTYVNNVVDSTTYSNWQGGKLTNASTTNGTSTKTVVSVESKKAYRCRAYYNSAKTYYWKVKNNTYTNTLYIYSSKAVSSVYTKDSDNAYNLPKTIKNGTSSGTKLGEIYIISVNQNWASSFTSGSNKGIYVWNVDTTDIWRNKTVKSHNVFEKWGNWSGWSTTQYTASGTRQVESRKIYTIREKVVQNNTHTHQWNSYYTTDRESTCYSYGIESIHCSTCGAVKDGSQRNKALKSHTYGGYTIDTQATCAKAGVKSKHCKVCNTIDSSSITTYTVDHTWSNSYVVDRKPTLTKEGVKSIHCLDCGTVKSGSETSIPKDNKLDADSIILQQDSYTYAKSGRRPEAFVLFDGKLLDKGTDYTVTYDKDYKKLGTHKVVIKGKGDYAGTITKTYSIKQGNVKLKKDRVAKAINRKKTQIYAIPSGNYDASYYEFRIAEDKKFKKLKVKPTKVKLIDKKIKVYGKLSKKKKYYMQVRAVKKIGTKKYYTAWSNTINFKGKN